MQATEYLKRVLETESNIEKLNISAIGLDMTFGIGVHAGNVMNKIKRAIAYGKELERAELVTLLCSLRDTADAMAQLVDIGGLQDDGVAIDLFGAQNPEFLAAAKVSNVNIRLLHGVIGEMSETAEKLEALSSQLLTGKLDLVNFGEELGDSAWYDAIQKDELQRLANAEANALELPRRDFSEEAIRERNIAKLQDKKNGRYKAGTFDPNAAINRDTAAERVILEQPASVAQ